MEVVKNGPRPNKSSSRDKGPCRAPLGDRRDPKARQMPGRHELVGWAGLVLVAAALQFHYNNNYNNPAGDRAIATGYNSPRWLLQSA